MPAAETLTDLGSPPGQAQPCRHQPTCPPADGTGSLAAAVIAAHPEQGWSLLCNGIITFDDTGALLPAGERLAPRRTTPAEKTPHPTSRSHDDTGRRRPCTA